MNSRITGHDSSVWKEVDLSPGLSQAMNSHIQDSGTFQTPKVLQAVLIVSQSAEKDGGQSRNNGGSCPEAVVHVVWQDTAILQVKLRAPGGQAALPLVCC